MSSKQLAVIIAGGGIGGLTAAVALRRAGHEVTVLKKSFLSNEVGQGITIMPIGCRALAAIGVDFQRAEIADSLGLYVIRADTLDSMFPTVRYDDDFQQYGIQMKTAYRVDLHRELVTIASDDAGEGKPAAIQACTAVRAFDAERGLVMLVSGEQLTADLIVAANGVKSLAAAHIIGPTCPIVEANGTLV